MSCKKFSFGQLLIEVFFEIIGTFGSIQPWNQYCDGIVMKELALIS